MIVKHTCNQPVLQKMNRNLYPNLSTIRQEEKKAIGCAFISLTSIAYISFAAFPSIGSGLAVLLWVGYMILHGKIMPSYSQKVVADARRNEDQEYFKKLYKKAVSGKEFLQFVAAITGVLALIIRFQ